MAPKLSRKPSDNDSSNKGDGKKPFDKKLYRLKKYSNKYKLEKWEEQRKKKMLHEYYKETKNMNGEGKYTLLNTEEEESFGRFVKHPDLIEIDQQSHSANKAGHKNAFWKARNHLNQLKIDKEEKRKQADKAREEKKAALEQYNKKKALRFKKLSQKTRRGQPVMSGRLELLLDKIKSSKN